MSALPDTLVVQGCSYAKIADRRQGGAVYRLAEASRDRILRLGKPQALDPEIAMARRLHAQGFPVAEVLADGMIGDMRYSVERFLGEERFGDIFARETAERGDIADESFASFEDITTRFALAQLGSCLPSVTYAEFADMTHVEMLRTERPEWSDRLDRATQLAWPIVSRYPTVFTHADYTQYNIYPTGIIDFETVAPAPFGYDLVTAVAHTEWFPDDPSYESFRRFSFTQERINNHYARLDDLCHKHGIPPLSEARRAFELFRGIWACVRMHDVPRLQAWRYERFEREYLRQ